MRGIFASRPKKRKSWITRHGRPAGILIGFASDEDWFEYRLEHHPEFLRRIEEARAEVARPAFIGFASDEDWFEYRLEHHHSGGVEEARAALRAESQGTPLREIE